MKTSHKSLPSSLFADSLSPSLRYLLAVVVVEIIEHCSAVAEFTETQTQEREGESLTERSLQPVCLPEIISHRYALQFPWNFLLLMLDSKSYLKFSSRNFFLSAILKKSVA